MIGGSCAVGPCLENNEIELRESLWCGPRREEEGGGGELKGRTDGNRTGVDLPRCTYQNKQAALNKFVLVQVHLNDKQLLKWDLKLLISGKVCRFDHISRNAAPMMCRDCPAALRSIFLKYCGKTGNTIKRKQRPAATIRQSTALP